MITRMSFIELVESQPPLPNATLTSLNELAAGCIKIEGNDGDNPLNRIGGATPPIPALTMYQMTHELLEHRKVLDALQYMAWKHPDWLSRIEYEEGYWYVETSTPEKETYRMGWSPSYGETIQRIATFLQNPLLYFRLYMTE